MFFIFYKNDIRHSIYSSKEDGLYKIRISGKTSQSLRTCLCSCQMLYQIDFLPESSSNKKNYIYEKKMKHSQKIRNRRKEKCNKQERIFTRVVQGNLIQQFHTWINWVFEIIPYMITRVNSRGLLSPSRAVLGIFLAPRGKCFRQMSRNLVWNKVKRRGKKEYKLSDKFHFLYCYYYYDYYFLVVTKEGILSIRLTFAL